MKYLLDASFLDTYASGAKQRFLTLYLQLIKINKDKKFIIIYSSFDQVKMFLNFPNVFFKKNPVSQKNYFTKTLSTIFIFFYLIMNYRSIKSVEFFTLPFLNLKRIKTVITIHDLRRIYFSNFFLLKYAYRYLIGIFLKNAHNVIVVSQAVKNEMQKYFNNLNITVIYNTIDLNYFKKKIPKQDIINIKKKYNLSKNFILTVGHLEKRKNFLTLIKTIYILKKDNMIINLVIVGQEADEVKNIRLLINKLKLNSQIKVFSKLNNLEVRVLYKSCKLFVFPSIYEGFGIPILECMALNKPMILSNTDVFREITENNSIYFDQYDPSSIANKIRYVLSSKEAQKKMIRYGKKRVKYFTIAKQKKNLNNFYSHFIDV